MLRKTKTYNFTYILNKYKEKENYNVFYQLNRKYLNFWQHTTFLTIAFKDCIHTEIIALNYFQILETNNLEITAIRVL